MSRRKRYVAISKRRKGCRLKAFVYRLYPSKAQARLMASTLETCRHFYNECLAERKEAWENEQRSVGKYEQLRRVKTVKAENPYAKEVHSHVLQVVVADLDKAYQAFFRRLKAGEKAGYPRFRGRNRVDSFGFKEYGNGFRVDGRRLKLSGIGRVAVRWHRAMEGKPKTVRIVRKADGWYACIACETEAAPLAATGKTVGVDVGLASLITTSEGEKVAHPHWYRDEQRKLRVLQRTVSRRTKGGANRRKAVGALQRQHQRIGNRRADFLNKLANDLIQRYDVIAVEDLRIRNMVRNRHLAKSILDAGWGYFRQRLHAKAACAARVIVEVDPAYTSQTCSGCGQRFPEHHDLSVRWIKCDCGLSLDRDENGARNILARAGYARWESTSAMVGVSQEAAAL